MIWLTQKNRERARRYFDVLGVDPGLLKDSSYIEYQLGLDIEGRELSFGTKEEYNGKRSVKVVWDRKADRSQPVCGALPGFSAPLAMPKCSVKNLPFDPYRAMHERS